MESFFAFAQAALRQTDGLGGHAQTTAVQRLHGVDEAHVLLAQHIALVDADILSTLHLSHSDAPSKVKPKCAF